MSYTIVGVTGHIDHGKTSLVAALTGIDTDTHPEEKRRGITIDLGFASFTVEHHRFALIDAPGHQKYIGNLLAGVSAVDVGMLVVACDQGIQAQTLEHAAILHSLGVSKLIVVISRIDLSDSATLAELTEELDLFLADYGFEEIPAVPVSSVTGQGLAELKGLLARMARTNDRPAPQAFRMPVDRVFTLEGRGCVVAGTPWSGIVRVGDHLQLVRSGELARVRELEVHDQPVTESAAGQRTAMNLAGVSAGDIDRGDELVGEGTHAACSRIVMQLTMFRDASEIRCPITVQLHTATSAREARLSGVRRIGPGQRSVVVVDTRQPIVATFLQQCLLRRPYPVGTFAGGRVLACVPPGMRQTTRLLELGTRLLDTDASERLTAWVEFQGELKIDPNWLELQLGVSSKDVAKTIGGCLADGRVQRPLDHLLVSTRAVDQIRGAVLKHLTDRAESREDAWLAEEALVTRTHSAASPDVVRWVIDRLAHEKLIVRVNQLVAIASEQTVLSKKQRAKMERILAMFVDSRQPPTLKEVAAQTETTPDAVSSLIRFATGQRILVDLGNGFFISRDTFRLLCRELRELFNETPHQPVAKIRDRWQVTRKHAIPLLEYCDRVAVTVRQGDERTAGPGLDKLLSESMPMAMTGDET